MGLFDKKEKMATPEQIKELNKLRNNLFGMVYDSFTNTVLNQGLYTNDPKNSSRYNSNHRLTWNISNIMQVEREEPIFRKILNYKASMALTKIDINSKEMSSEEIKYIKKQIDKIYKPLYDMIYQGEAFGGGACLICIKNQMSEKELMKPLDINTVQADYFLGLKTLERWFSCTPTGDLIESIGDNGIDDPNLLGEPLYFKVRLGGKNTKQIKVHRSRLLIYTTGSLPEIQKRIEQYWGVSALERVWEPLNRYKVAINAVINMFLISSQRVLQTDIDTEYASMTERAYEAMKTKLQIMAQSLNYSNVLFLGSDDKFTYESVQMSNVNEVLKSIRLDLCSCAEVPMSYMFDDGVNDTQTTENAHACVKTIQKLYMSNYYNILIPLIYKSKYGGQVPEFDITFNKLREISDKDTADVVEKMVRAIVEVYKVNGMDKETFIRSLSEIMQNNNDVFNNYKEEFIKKYGGLTYVDDQVELAKALNQGNDQYNPGKEKVKEINGPSNNDKKPTPRVKINEGSE